MKKRWKGLCALWMVLILVIGAFPVAGASEDVPESAAAAVSEAAGDGGGQALTDSGAVESSLETMSEGSSSETESTELEESENTESSSETETSAESSAEDGTGEEPGQSRETEEPDKGTGSSEATEGSEEGNGESTEKSTETAKGDGTAQESSEAVSEENESESGKPEEGGTTEETSSEESSVEEIPSEESSSEESSQEEILETTDPELLENVALLAKAVAREAATSGDGWLYVGSDEVKLEGSVGDTETSSYKKLVTVQFDKPFDEQVWMDNITIPQNKSLSGWKLWKFNSGMVVDEELGELEISGQISADNYQNFSIDNSNSFLLIVPLLRIKDISDGDTLEMNAGDSCNLSEGTWQVDGDATIYTIGTGGCTVYAAKSGTFTFYKSQ